MRIAPATTGGRASRAHDILERSNNGQKQNIANLVPSPFLQVSGLGRNIRAYYTTNSQPYSTILVLLNYLVRFLVMIEALVRSPLQRTLVVPMPTHTSIRFCSRCTGKDGGYAIGTGLRAPERATKDGLLDELEVFAHGAGCLSCRIVEGHITHLCLWTVDSMLQNPPNEENKALIIKHQIHKCTTYCTPIGGKCRFYYPRAPNECRTHLNDKGRYVLQREGDEFVNGYNMELLRFGRVNMDLQYNQRDKAKKHMCKYVTK